jgi:hypothetical protein
MIPSIELWPFEEAPVGFRHRVNPKNAQIMVFVPRWFREADMSFLDKIGTVKCTPLGMDDKIYVVYNEG